MKYLVSGDWLLAMVRKWIGGEKADFWRKKSGWRQWERVNFKAFYILNPRYSDSRSRRYDVILIRENIAPSSQNSAILT